MKIEIENISETEVYKLYNLISTKIEELSKIDVFSCQNNKELFENICKWEGYDCVKCEYDKSAEYTIGEIIEKFEEAEHFFNSCEEFNIMENIIKNCDECIGLFCYLADHRELWNEIKNVFLVKRIFTNSILIKHCLAPLIEITKNKNNLSTKLEHELNICIIIAQTDYFKNIFSRKIRELSRRFYGMEGCDVKVLYLMGLLNFRKNSYKEALYFLKKACASYKGNYLDDHYFQTRILLAYCYEYMHEFDKAIKELIGYSANDFLEISERIAVNYNVFEDEEYKVGVEEVRAFYENLEKEILKDEKQQQSRSVFYDAILRDKSKNSNAYGDRHEILHSFAHCCNELAVKCKKSQNANNPNSEQLFAVARNTMLFVANADRVNPKTYADFSTCLFMIYAEANDFEYCEKQIDAIMKDESQNQNNKNLTYYERSIKAIREKYNEKGDFWAEVNFYKYLVSYFSFKSISEKKIGLKQNDEEYKRVVKKSYEDYLNYAKCRYDYDAEAYIKIFEYKFKLAKSLRKASDFMSLRNMIKEAVEGASELKRPSPFVNEWIQYEYERIVLAGELINRFVCDAPLDELYAIASRCRRMYAYSGKESFFDLKDDESNQNNDQKDYEFFAASNNENNIDIEIEQKPEKKILKYRQINTGKLFILSYGNEIIRASSPGEMILVCASEEEAKRIACVFYVLDIIMNDFVSPRSIFILAPLSAAAPYQYQTGNVKELVTSIFASDETHNFLNGENEIVQSFRTVGNYDQNIIKRIGKVESVFKMIAFSKIGDESYYYMDKHWTAPIKRPFAKEVGNPLYQFLTRVSANGALAKNSLGEKRHDGCTETSGCRVFLYKYNDDEAMDKIIDEILKRLFISSRIIVSGDWVLLKSSNYEWYITVIKQGIDEKTIWETISPQLCGKQPKKEKAIVYNNNEDDFITICYTSQIKEVVESDAKYLSRRGYRIWYDEKLNGIEKWLEQVKRRVLDPKCHKVIIYITSDMYEKYEKIPKAEEDGLFQEIKFIYEHNKNYPNDTIKYLVVLVGEPLNGIRRFRQNLFKELHDEGEEERLKIIADVIFGEGRVHGVRTRNPEDVQHFEKSSNKCHTTLFSENAEWKCCCEAGEDDE